MHPVVEDALVLGAPHPREIGLVEMCAHLLELGPRLALLETSDVGADQLPPPPDAFAALLLRSAEPVLPKYGADKLRRFAPGVSEADVPEARS